MQRSSGRPPAGSSPPNAEFLRQRLTTIVDGLREGIRREIARRERLGLPIYVAENGTVVNRQTNRSPPDSAKY